jgi:hypothetical protein
MSRNYESALIYVLNYISDAEYSAGTEKIFKSAQKCHLYTGRPFQPRDRTLGFRASCMSKPSSLVVASLMRQPADPHLYSIFT